ncbi:tachykinin-like peptides receptor 86C [Maniola jurtina]|uniref:tachykinin-like peptides receptor 86C n=1 Tax=Maniola jurtina TaxID=191418 RepID=UPI001E68ACC1|nr:tachykinin-like peptides receptor 86C [Maniola jurtina]
MTNNGDFGGKMDVMSNITLLRKKFYAEFKNQTDRSGVEIIYTWKMDFNQSLLAAATVLVPQEPSASLLAATMPAWAYNSWVGLFTFMMTVAIGGNAIVIWIVAVHRRMRTVTNYFLVNLSCADLLMASLNCLFNFVYMLQSDWVFGELFCRLSNFIANVTVTASVFTLTGISYDRYQAIVRPMRPRMSKRYSLIMIAGIWVSGVLLAMPCLLFSTTKQYRSKGTIKTACLLLWPDGLPDVSHMDFVYQVLFFVITYVAPMLGMIFFYTAMGRVLWGSKSIGELTQRQLDSIHSKRKVVKMFILVIVIFGICWLPYQLYFVYAHFNPSVMFMKHIQHIYLAFYWLAMANAMVNPIIYYWMNAKFRSYFQTVLLCRWRMPCYRKRRPPPESPPDYVSQSGSRSRSGVAGPRSSRGNAAVAWPRLSSRTPEPLTQRPPLPASCPRCPNRTYDAIIHGRKV